jgi:hypothetical protein
LKQQGRVEGGKKEVCSFCMVRLWFWNVYASSDGWGLRSAVLILKVKRWRMAAVVDAEAVYKSKNNNNSLTQMLLK